MTQQNFVQDTLAQAAIAIGQVTNWQNTSDSFWVGSTGQWRFTASIQDGQCRATAALGTTPIQLPQQLAAQIQTAVAALNPPAPPAGL
jgi:hypothetical protein